MNPRWLCVIPLAVVCCLPPIRADEPATYESVLSQEIIGPQLALEEVQVYTESAVPQMPTCRSAAEWRQHAERIRRDVLDRAVFRGQAASWRDADCRVEWLDTIAGGPGYRIRKLRYEALPGLWIPALLYEPEKLVNNAPVMLAVNGHVATGKATPYKQIRCINLARRGMIVLNCEWFNMGQLRGDNFQHYRLNQLDLCGTSGLAPFFLSMSRGIDILLDQPHADRERVAVSGLSGGGWQTIIISALDPRVTLANPVAGYSSFRTRVRNFSDLGDSEQTPVDLGTAADYAHLTAMMAPRALLLTYNAKDDCCFQSDHALPPLIEAAGPVYKLFGREDRLRWHVNHDPGTHNYERDNREAFYRMVKDHFYAGSADFDATELECGDEVKSEDDLFVPLPDDNLDFHQIAMRLAAELPRQSMLPSDAISATAWQAEHREMLRDVLRIRAEPPRVDAERVGSKELPGATASLWRLRCDRTWTVPAVELAPAQPRSTVVLAADAGRASLTDRAQELVAAGNRVLAIDPFYLGESKIASHDFLFALLVSAVGDRPLGVQARQIGAAAEWARGAFGGQPVTIETIGSRTSLAALCAAGLYTEAIAAVEMHGAWGSLKETLEQNCPVTDAPELFCFGLLERFDTRQLAALTAPRPVTFHEAGDRAHAEMATLAAWYDLLGTPHQPFP
jgi:hypothetical protein